MPIFNYEDSLKVIDKINDINFVLEHTSLSVQDLNELNAIAEKLTGEGLNVKETMQQIWKDVTTNVRKGDKQTEWKAYGTDTAMQEWAMEISNQFHSNAENLLEDNDEIFELLNRADEILNKVIEM